ncbi:MAG: helix-hairpin-helix domain-containing protein [Rikenellaceae bacterium]
MKKYLSLTSSQVRGTLVLMVAVLIIVKFFGGLTRVKVEDSFVVLSDTLVGVRQQQVVEAKKAKVEVQKEEIVLFDFDPNTIDFKGLRALGFSASEAAGIIKYRTKYNKVFELATDFATLYQVSDSVFYALEPYIKIQRELQKDTVKVEVKKPKKLVDINVATLAQLDSLPGIGELTARRIIEYRTRLGGFTKISQLKEVEGMMEKNFLRFEKEIFVKNDDISKIDINFAGAEIMKEHPYMTGLIIRKVLKHRQLKGGLGSITEMIEAHILTREEAQKLSDYLIFNH